MDFLYADRDISPRSGKGMDNITEIVSKGILVTSVNVVVNLLSLDENLMGGISVVDGVDTDKATHAIHVKLFLIVISVTEVSDNLDYAVPAMFMFEVKGAPTAISERDERLKTRLLVLVIALVLVAMVSVAV